MIRQNLFGRAGLMPLAILAMTFLADAGFDSEVAAQGRVGRGGRAPERQSGVLLREKPHQSNYRGVLEVVGVVGGQEQYRVGPDTIVLGIDVREGENSSWSAEYRLDLGEGDPAVGSLTMSELGIDAQTHWRPTLEGLTLVSFLPLPADAQQEGAEWASLVAYTLADLGLEFAEATRFRVRSIRGDEVTISYSAEGGGSTTIDRPQLGAGATMEVTRESAREGHFVFDVSEGRVISSERLERITTTSVIFMGDDDPQVGPEEVQTLTFRLLPFDGS